MITVVDLSRSGSTAHNTVGDNQRAYVTTIVLRLKSQVCRGSIVVTGGAEKAGRRAGLKQPGCHLEGRLRVIDARCLSIPHLVVRQRLGLDGRTDIA